MADSDFWRELAVQFHGVDDHTLAADWNQETDSDHIRWELRGAESTKSEFDPLARRGAIKLGPSNATDLLSTWLNAVRAEMPSGDRSGTGRLQDDTGVERTFTFGTIERICLVSAQLCKKFESRALEKERDGPSIELVSDEPVLAQQTPPDHDALPVPTVEPNLQELRSFRAALDGQDALLRDGIDRSPNYDIPLAQWLAIKGVLADIIAKIPDCSMRLTFHSEPNVVRAQIGRVRAKIQHMIDILESAQSSASAIVSVSSSRSEPNKATLVPVVRPKSLPNRAAWLADRLKERDWDWNEPYRWSGPDRKTVKKILDGKFVRPDMLRKLIVALNHKKIGKNLSALDIPSD